MSPSSSDIECLLARARQGDGAGDGVAELLASFVFRKNRENALRFLSTPFSQRMVLVPQCLRSTSGCQAEERGNEYLCRRCGACKIARIAQRAQDLGYLGTKILKGGSALVRLVGETQAKAVLGVCCCIEGVLGILACERAGVPAFCVPLLRSGCADTDVDLADVSSALEAMVP